MNNQQIEPQKNNNTLKEKIPVFFRMSWTKILVFPLIFYIFFPFFNEKIINHFIPFFEKCQRTFLNDVIFIIILILGLLNLSWKLFSKQYYINLTGIYYSIIITILFITHRFIIVDLQGWYFTSFLYFPSIKYVDVIFLLLLFFTLNFSKRKKILKPESKKTFLEDSHSTFGNSDLLKREGFSVEVAEYILNTKTEYSFAIAISGKWGSGKSIFLTQLEKALSTNTIIIKFNPWRSKNSNQILEDFFDSLINELKTYNKQLSKEIENYSRAILAADDNSINKIFNQLFKLFFTERSITKQYDDVRSFIKSLKSKIVVIIDDIDRLDEEEILEVLRIVRNTANFPDTFFIVAFDHVYVESALKNSKIPSPNQYLEKVFQLEINLPSYPYNILYSKQIELLNSNRSEEEQKQISGALYQIANTKKEPIVRHKQVNLYKDYVQNLRDVVRFSNSFNLYYDLKKNEVDLVDYIALELIKLKYLNVYNSIVEQLVFNQFGEYIELNDKDHNDLKLIFNADKFETFMENQIPKKQIELLTTTLSFLFNRERSSIAFRAISAPSNSLIYLSNDLFSRISSKEFNDSVNSSKDTFLTKINDWISNAQHDDLKDIFLKSNIFKNRQTFENIIHGIINLCRHVDLPVLKDNLFEKLKKQDTIAIYYENDLNIYKNFINSIVDEAEYPYIIESDLLFQFLHPKFYDLQKETNSTFTEKELKDWILKLFKKFVDNTRAVDANAFKHYYNCIDKIDENSNIYLSPQANSLFTLLIGREPQIYIKQLIRPNFYPHDGKTFTLEPYIKQTFDGFDNFIKFLNSHPESFDALEVKTFFRKYLVNKEKGLEFIRGSIEYISDETMLFLGSKKYPEIPNNTPAVSFFHPNYSEKLIRHQKDFEYSNWVAHVKPEDLDSIQASNGGDYKFEYKFFIPSDMEIKSSKIILAVDDSCNIDINNQRKQTGIVTFQQDSQEINIMLQTGRNNLTFEIFNTDNMGVGQPARSVIKGIENPYGIIFIIKVELEQIK
jgi:hypothetical protein